MSFLPERGMSLLAVAVILAIVVAVAAAIFILLPRGEPESSLREADTAVSTRAACEAGCRDQYGGSGSAGFDACIRSCGAGGAAGVLREAACSGDVAPGCEAPTTPVCKNGKWICIGPASPGTSVAPMPQPQPQPTPKPTPAPTPESSPTAPAPAPQEASKTVSVSIQGFAFSPATVTIKAGDTVVFKNFDSVAHTATQSGGFDSGTLAQGQSKSITFSQKGTFNYHCVPHPNMTGTIIVE